MVNISPEFINKLGILNNFKSLFSEFSGIDLDIIEVNGEPVKFPCSEKKATGRCCNLPQANKCNELSNGILQEIKESSKPRFYLCPGGLKKIMVPMRHKDGVLGVAFAGETHSSKIDKPRLQALSQLLDQITNYILDNETSSLRYFKGSAITRQQQILQKVIKYIEDNGREEKLSLFRVARENAVSYHYLSHLFQQELNTTFVKFCKQVKMDFAAKLLKDASRTVSEVSHACGFEDPSYFCKVFRATHGCTAETYRKRLLAKKALHNGNGLRKYLHLAPLSRR